MKLLPLLLLLLLTNAAAVWADETTQNPAPQGFVVSDIRVEGLQRISSGSIFSALPVRVGDRANAATIRRSIRNLFRSGNFDNVSISRDGSILVVAVIERPSISEITIEGNKAIETDALLDGLRNAGLAEGEVFRRSTLEGMKLELTRQYVSQGRYDASVETDVTSLPRNRVAVAINVDEGSTSAIKLINIVGNKAFSDEDLVDLFELKTTGWFSWISGNDKYSREKLSGDLDTLESHYLDRGYIQFKIISSQVSVNPDRDAVYVTVNIDEGDKYEVGEVKLSGDLILSEDQLNPYVFIKQGDTFSQQLVTSSEEWLTKRLGNEGYNFAEVKGIPEIDDESKIVDLKFFIDPGKRTYVRRISFTGNTRTADEVLRREMRQMESAPASSASIELSRIRLERLGFFKEAKVETIEVPGSDDLIDLEYVVEEQSSGSISASLGYSQDSGVLLGGNLEENNFLGTGKQVGIGINKSDYLSAINFSYVNPYYTPDGVSRGFSLFYRETDLSEINVSSYSTSSIGANVNFGYPIKETQRLNFSLGISNTKIDAGINAVQEIIGSPRLTEIFVNRRTGIENFGTYFVNQPDGTPEVVLPLFDENGNVLAPEILTEPVGRGFLEERGNNFNTLSLTATWSQSTLNRGRLATRGASQSVSVEVTAPGSDLEYFKVIYKGQIFLPMTNDWVFRLRTELGYGDGYDGEGLPFFKNFYAGGFGSVRGFKSNTLGPRGTSALRYDTGNAVVAGENGSLVRDPRASYEVGEDGKIGVFLADRDPDPFGGNVLIEGGIDLLFPLPFIKDNRSFRSAFFIDAGNVFSTDCGVNQLNCFDVDPDEFRYSFGVGFTWISGFGPLTFSLAKPLNPGPDDEEEAFQFSLGRSF